YWSLDPCGIDQLSDEVAQDLGFPTIRLKMKVSGFSWDANVYDGIHQFHAAKGFDHHSQEVALEVGNPLYQVSYDQESLFAHSEPGIIV
ncbi:hypothetical protein B0H14DRAFT_2342510, partial [Mycena olivaceomarginata]